MSVGTYYYYAKLDKSTEAVDKIFTTGRLAAAKHFANRKNLPLKEFLKIWSVSKKEYLIMDPNKKEGVDPAAQPDQGLDQWLDDLDKELDILEEEQKERWSIDDKPE